MDESEDDNWVREFDVSNPQKTHAGYTVYRVSSKVYPKGFPEGASEVIVFKRYSEFRALYKELRTIYENKNVEKKKFPRFAKGHYFDRFDESVLEERQKQALSLLLFTGNVSFLFTSQPFVKFFEGGVEHAGRGSSHNSSDSEQAINTEDLTASTSNETWTPEMYFSEKQDSSDDETIYEISRDLSKTNLSLNIKKTSADSDEGDSMKQWLARAMSLCSEGDDIEALASEAAGYSAQSRDENCFITSGEDVDTADKELKPQLSQGSIDMLPTLLENSEDEDVFVEIVSPRKSDDFEENPTLREETDCELSHPVDTQLNNASLSQDSLQEIRTGTLVSSTTKYDDRTDPQARETDQTREYDLKETNNVQEPTPAETTNHHKQVGRSVSNIAMSWIDPKKKDYLYNAAQIIQQALYCEANEMYEEAFNKYKICVGILLNGVQHDSDAKRREAVRRKTAQYLVKAEFLFNTYLKLDAKDSSDWSVKPRSSSQVLADRNMIDQQFSHLTLASLKVIGVIGKSMLVQCEELDGLYCVKALHKTNAVHRSNRQENKQTNKSFSKKYVRSCRMVKLHHHFDTNDSIFLLLEYAAGGCLWSHVKSLRKRFDTSSLSEENVGVSDDTSGKRAVDKEFGPECLITKQRLDCDDVKNSNGNSRDFTNTECSGEQFLNPLKGPNNLETNISNSSVKFSTKDKLTSTKTISESESDISPAKHRNVTPPSGNINSHEFYEQKNCLTGQKLHNISLEHRDIETDPSRGVLGFLDHVTHDHSLVDKCVQRWIAELLLAINSVHSCGIILKDLKPCNVLLDENSRVKLSYFGAWEEVDHSVDAEAVKQFYCAPEISRGEKITFAADWWSLGVLSYELLTGKTLSCTHPWGIYPHSSIIFPREDISTEARSLLSGLICHNSGERLGSGMDGVEGIKSHAFFQGVDWDELAKSS